MEPFVIREATKRDVPAVCALWKEMMDFHRQYDPRFVFAHGAAREFEHHITSTMRSQGARVFVAESVGRVVGYIAAEVHARKPIYPVGYYGFISDISVTSEFRRRGVGRALVEAVDRWFARERVTAVELYVAEANPTSTAFWRALGFSDYLRLLRREVGEQKRDHPSRE